MSGRMIRDDFCVSTRPYGHWTIEYTLNSIRNCGFKNVEFWAGSPHYCYADYSPEERSERREYLKTLFAENGLTMKIFSPEQIGSYPLNIASQNELVREFSVQILLDYVDDAAYFGAEIMRLDTGFHFIDQNASDHVDKAVRSIQIIAEKAATLGITLYIEAMAQTTGTFAYDLDTLATVLKMVNMPNVKAGVGLAALLAEERTVLPSFNALNSQVAVVHFADAGGFVPGEKTDRTASILDELTELNYTGPKVLEITYRDCCLAADKVVFRSAEWLKQYCR